MKLWLTLLCAALIASVVFGVSEAKKNESTTPTPDKSSSFAVGSFFGGTLLGMLLMLGLMVLYNCWLRRRMNGGGLSSY
ncbi:hypothetical protein L596_007028 [Steinernema carpocapsae]|uniref:Transmembrane protein 242 n=1 Tax=Steinernema carpocapsae TaxID=34508 RepID=A0A4U5P7X8_STECR|nr:hypothetical protein L596_007028 [Steinernema carpocapsae]